MNAVLKASISAAILTSGDSGNQSDASAQEQAASELAKNKYDTEPSLIARLLMWLQEHVNIKILRASESSTTDIIIGVLAILAIIAIILICVRFIQIRIKRKNRLHKNDHFSGLLFGDQRSSSTLFSDAEAAFAAGQLNSAIIDTFRGIIRLLSEHNIIVIRPSLTASEASREASTAVGFPALFSSAAENFNHVYFSDAHAKKHDYERLVLLREKVRAFLANIPKEHLQEKKFSPTAAEQPRSARTPIRGRNDGSSN